LFKDIPAAGKIKNNKIHLMIYLMFDQIILFMSSFSGHDAYFYSDKLNSLI